MDSTPTFSSNVPEQSLMTDIPQPGEQATPTNTPQPESTDMQLTQSEEKFPDIPQKGGLTISTIPKCQLETKPDFEFSTLPMSHRCMWILPVRGVLYSSVT